MENITFTYLNKDGNETYTVNISKDSENCLHCADICETFLDFMRSIGFTRDSVYEYLCE